MANIQERVSANGKKSYRVQIRIRGYPAVSETFERKTDAKRWAIRTEAEIRERKYFKTSESQRRTLAEAIDRYMAMPSIQEQKNFRNKRTALEWWKEEIGYLYLVDVTPAIIGEKRDKLRGTVTRTKRKFTASSVNRHLATLSHMFTMATKEWGWIDANPCQLVTKLKEARGRDRYLSDEEREKLLDACRNSESPYIYPIVMIALTTGMRKGEILNLTWNDVDVADRRIIIRETKNGEVRAVPIVDAIVPILKDLRAVPRIDTNLLFPSMSLKNQIEIKTAWRTALRNAKIKDFRFHDLRHSCASYLAMNGATPSEIAAVLGHKTLSMVKRYSHISEQHVADVIGRMSKKVFS